FYTIALSRNMFFNGAERYEDNSQKSGAKLFDMNSHEIENKLRIDVNKYLGGWKLSYGLGTQYVKYDADIFNTVQQELRDENNTIVSPELTVNSNAAIDFFKFGAYIHSSKYFWDDRVLLSAG